MQPIQKERTLFVIDIDNTLANTNQALKNLGYNVDIYPAPLPKNIFNSGTLFEELTPIHSNCTYIKDMINDETHKQVIFLTARPKTPTIEQVTIDWLIAHDLTDTNDPPLFFTNGKPKGQWLLDHYHIYHNDNIVVFEDAPHEIVNYLNLSKENNQNLSVYVPRWPYNQHIKRCTFF